MKIIVQNGKLLNAIPYYEDFEFINSITHDILFNNNWYKSLYFYYHPNKYRDFYWKIK